MMFNQLTPAKRTSRLQEAIDEIVQSFGYPERISLKYVSEDEDKQTIFEVKLDEKVLKYKLTYDNRDDTTEPELTRLE